MNEPDPQVSSPQRELPGQRTGAPKAGEKKRRYMRYKRVATLAALVLLTAAAVITVRFIQDQNDGGEERATRAIMDDLARALDGYYERKRVLPTRVAQLLGPDSPYQGGPIPEDAWRHVIQYKVVDSRAGTWRLRSWGADGKPDTDDDMEFGGAWRP